MVPDWLSQLEAVLPDMGERWARHAQERHISAAEYHQKDRLALGAKALSHTRIYLEQKYWIYCRDAHLGRPAAPIHGTIWGLLCELVDVGRVICPASYPILAETLKQGNAERRMAIAHVIDRLSKQIALQPFEELIRTEVLHAVTALFQGADAVHPLKLLAWTRPSHIAGESLVHFPALSAEDNETVQKMTIDLFAALPFSSLIDSTMDAPDLPRADSSEYADELNASAQQHQHEVTSFDTVFMNEIEGGLDGLQGDIADMTRYFFERHKGVQPPLAGSPEDLAGAQVIQSAIFDLYKNGLWRKQFPYLHILSGIHAAIRYRQQPYRAGDQWDHLHAHSALAYCDAFFTEKSLAGLLCQTPLNYDTAYNCRVLVKPEEIVAYLRSLQTSSVK